MILTVKGGMKYCLRRVEKFINLFIYFLNIKVVKIYDVIHVSVIKINNFQRK